MKIVIKCKDLKLIAIGLRKLKIHTKDGLKRKYWSLILSALTKKMSCPPPAQMKIVRRMKMSCRIMEFKKGKPIIAALINSTLKFNSCLKETPTNSQNPSTSRTLSLLNHFKRLAICKIISKPARKLNLRRESLLRILKKCRPIGKYDHLFKYYFVYKIICDFIII